jgi:hypothetical protein
MRRRQTRDPEDIERREHAAYARGRAEAPERTASEAVLGRSEGEVPDDDREDVATARAEDPAGDAYDEAALDWARAEEARPDPPGETEDGLDETAEEVRREAEDRRAPEGE